MSVLSKLNGQPDHDQPRRAPEPKPKPIWECRTKPSDRCAFKECDGGGRLYWADANRVEQSHSTCCRCHYLPAIQKQWLQSVGEHDRWIRLSKLAPSAKSKLPLNMQQKCIDIMKADPLGSYAIFGGSGTSKSTFCVALYRYALFAEPSNHNNIIRIKAKTLLELIQQEKYEEHFKRANHQSFLTARQISRGTRLYLEELEKVKYTESRSTELFDVIDAIYERGGQLVVTGNLSFADLNDINRFPEGFARRIDEICAKHKWDFWKYTKEEVHA